MAVAHDPTVIDAVIMAEELDITDYILVGDEKKIIEYQRMLVLMLKKTKYTTNPTT